MSTLDDSAEVPGAARTPGNSSSGEPPSAAATPVGKSVYEGADKIVPSTAPTGVAAALSGSPEDELPGVRAAPETSAESSSVLILSQRMR